METYRKSPEHVEVYLYTGKNTTALVYILDRAKAEYTVLETPINFGLDRVLYKCSITIKQDGNTFVLTPGQYLVKDNLNTFSVYSELRFKKLFDKVHY